MTSVSVRASVPERGVDLDLAVDGGCVTALVGPNGAGKTTFLHLVAGLVRPASGTVRLGDREVSGPGRLVPPHRRRVALLTQRSALFPHLDVLANVAFGPRAAGLSRSDALTRAAAELDAVGCAHLARRRAHELSGGQAQRVAIARALAADPEVVLLDEPLAGLDVAAAAEVRHALASRLRGRTALLVTHDVLDLWAVADRVAVLERGRIVEEGPTTDLLTRPTVGFLARLTGTNLLAGEGRGAGVLEVGPGLTLYGQSDPGQPLVAGRPGLASIHPSAVSVHVEPPSGSPRTVIAGVVSALEPRGDVVRVRLDVGGHSLAADLTVISVAELGLAPGRAVWAAVKATQVRLYGRPWEPGIIVQQGSSNNRVTDGSRTAQQS